MGERDRVYTAAVVVIGNEVLSGRVQDANVHHLAGVLKQAGVRLREARIVPDVDEVIVATVNELRAAHDYVFTTGGIGPTHDDITAASVARAFGVPLERNAEAVRLLEAHYGDELNQARLRMASVPLGAELLDNPVSGAPGFRLENVFVLPGVPRIMQAMVDGFRHTLAGGRPLLSRTVTAALAESLAAAGLEAIATRHPQVEVGSYPFMRQGRFGTALVMRAVEPDDLDAVTREVEALVRSLGVEPTISDGEGRPPGD
jgi:molybdenum cofactor synthesis domain-containing protein